jgi:hypothetical protein
MGMSLSLANALQWISFSWINTKAAPFGGLIARKEYFALDTLFFRTLRQSMTVCAAGVLFVWVAVVYMNWAHIRFAQRLLSPIPIGFLLLVAMMNVIVFAQAIYLRAHKQEKFLIPSVIGAILTACSTYFLGKHYGAFGMVTGSLIIGLFFGVPSGTYVFLKYRRIWHAG